LAWGPNRGVPVGGVQPGPGRPTGGNWGPGRGGLVCEGAFSNRPGGTGGAPPGLVVAEFVYRESRGEWGAGRRTVRPTPNWRGVAGPSKCRDVGKKKRKEGGGKQFFLSCHRKGGGPESVIFSARFAGCFFLLPIAGGNREAASGSGGWFPGFNTGPGGGGRHPPNEALGSAGSGGGGGRFHLNGGHTSFAGRAAPSDSGAVKKGGGDRGGPGGGGTAGYFLQYECFSRRGTLLFAKVRGGGKRAPGAYSPNVKPRIGPGGGPGWVWRGKTCFR